MTSSTDSYGAGTWFGIPLRNGGYARGVITRVGNRGILFGYFFGPKLDTPPQVVPDDLFAENQILRGKFGDSGLLKDGWIVIGHKSDWKAEDWPLPPMIRVDNSAKLAFISYYSDENLTLISEGKCNPNLINNFPYDRLMGAGSVEIRLTKLLDK